MFASNVKAKMLHDGNGSFTNFILQLESCIFVGSQYPLSGFLNSLRWVSKVYKVCSSVWTLSTFAVLSAWRRAYQTPRVRHVRTLRKQVSRQSWGRGCRWEHLQAVLWSRVSHLEPINLRLYLCRTYYTGTTSSASEAGALWAKRRLAPTATRKSISNGCFQRLGRSRTWCTASSSTGCGGWSAGSPSF